MKLLTFILLIFIFLIYLEYDLKRAEAQEVRNWKGIVVHHSGSIYDNLEKIDAYHKSKGWDGCGYHFVIEKDGQVKIGRSLNKVGAHAKTCGPNRNRTHIGICLTGDNIFTFKQSLALGQLCAKLIREHSIVSIERHHEECPGPGINVEKLEQEIFAGL